MSYGPIESDGRRTADGEVFCCREVGIERHRAAINKRIVRK